MSAALQVRSPQTKFALRIIRGPQKGEIYKINPPGLIVGRDMTTCKIALEDPRISRQQCRIDFHSHGISIEDLSGKNTTIINGNAITAPHELQSGDEIHIGDTFIEFQILDQKNSVSSSPISPSLSARLGALKPSAYSAPSPQTSSGPQKSYKGYIVIACVCVVGAITFFLLPDVKKPNSNSKVTSADDLNKAIEAVQEHQKKIEKARGELTDTTSQSYYNYYTAEKNYIRGFRDYQNGKYSRAIEAFQTTLAVNPKHPTARRYYRLAEKKRQERVDQYMDIGRKYKEKNLYRMCIAEFEKVLQTINQPNNKKYQLAKEQIRECRLCQGGQCTEENAKKEVNGASQN